MVKKTLLLIAIVLPLLFLIFLGYLATREPIINRGLTGTDGEAGTRGETGLSGSDGSVGITGETGAEGDLGATGAEGDSGATGQTGLTGQAGTTGAISLLIITTEGSGSNCASGGKKIESGLDINSNDILDVSEIGATNYVCNGSIGITGLNGLMGLPGQDGADGPQGLQGIPGTNAPVGYGYIYNLTVRSVALDAPIIFDSSGPLLGIAHTVGTADITISNAGVYSISFVVSGTEPNQFTVFVNGLPSTSTLYGSGAGTQQNYGQAILSLLSGDVLTIVNDTSTAAITLATVIGGTGANVNASVLIERLD